MFGYAFVATNVLLGFYGLLVPTINKHPIYRQTLKTSSVCISCPIFTPLGWSIFPGGVMGPALNPPCPIILDSVVSCMISMTSWYMTNINVTAVLGKQTWQMAGTSNSGLSITSGDGLQFIIQKCLQERGDTGGDRSIDKLCKASCILKVESGPIRILRWSSRTWYEFSTSWTLFELLRLLHKSDNNFKLIDCGWRFIG